MIRSLGLGPRPSSPVQLLAANSTRHDDALSHMRFFRNRDGRFQMIALKAGTECIFLAQRESPMHPNHLTLIAHPNFGKMFQRIPVLAKLLLDRALDDAPRKSDLKPVVGLTHCLCDPFEEELDSPLQLG